MRVGFQLPEIERRVSWNEMRTMATEAEQGGLDSIWVGEHLLYDTPEGHRGPWEAFSVLSALAAVTERLRLGPLVAATSFHNPALLAKQAATLDEISGGRFIFGLGAGWNETEFTAFGFPFHHRASRFIEAFTVIRTLLTDGHIDFHGDFYDLPDCVLDPLGPTPGGPPLLIGSTGPKVLAATLPHVQAWNAWYSVYGNDPGRAPDLLATIDQAIEAAGRHRSDIAKTLSMIWHFETEPVVRSADHIIRDTFAMTEALDALHQAGVDEVQLVLDPITVKTVGLATEVVAEWRSSRT